MGKRANSRVPTVSRIKESSSAEKQMVGRRINAPCVQMSDGKKHADSVTQERNIASAFRAIWKLEFLAYVQAECA